MNAPSITIQHWQVSMAIYHKIYPAYSTIVKLACAEDPRVINQAKSAGRVKLKASDVDVRALLSSRVHCICYITWYVDPPRWSHSGGEEYSRNGLHKVSHYIRVCSFSHLFVYRHITNVRWDLIHEIYFTHYFISAMNKYVLLLSSSCFLSWFLNVFILLLYIIILNRHLIFIFIPSSGCIFSLSFVPETDYSITCLTCKEL